MTHSNYSLRPTHGFRALACLSLAGVWLIGCTPKTAEQQHADTDRVLNQIGVASKTRASGSRESSNEETGLSSTRQADIADSVLPNLPLLNPPTPSTPSPTPPNRDTSQPGDPSTSQPAPTSSSQINTDDDPTEPWTTSEKLPIDYWEVLYVGNTPVGYSHRKTEVSDSLGATVFRLEAESRLRVSANGKATDQVIRISTIERNNGELFSINGSVQMGENQQSFQGLVTQDTLRLTTQKDGQTTHVTLPWKSTFRGPFAVDQSMQRKPLKPKEIRYLQYFDPILGQVINGRLEALEKVVTPTLLGGSHELLEVRNVGLYGGSEMRALLWVDSRGQGYKSYMESADLRSFRTEPLAAQVIAAISDLRGLLPRTVPLTGATNRLLENSKESITYRIKLNSDDPFGLFSERTNQRVRSIDPRTLELTVFSTELDSESFGGIRTEPNVDEGSKSESEFIQISNNSIQKLVKALKDSDKKLQSDQTSDLDKALVCRQALFKRVGVKEFDAQIGSFAAVMRNRQANCVEHALLLATTCRAMNVPARLAFGYLFNRSLDAPAMKFHAWTEIRHQDRWIPVDSSDSPFPTSLDRIKLLESNLSTTNPYLEILKVYRLIPDLEIQVLPQ